MLQTKLPFYKMLTRPRYTMPLVVLAVEVEEEGQREREAFILILLFFIIFD